MCGINYAVLSGLGYWRPFGFIGLKPYAVLYRPVGTKCLTYESQVLKGRHIIAQGFNPVNYG